MWRVYRRTRKDEDYTNYKNLATTEIRKSKRTFEKKSKQKVRDKVGSLENNRGNIISDRSQMAEVLNEYFSSVFTTTNISSLTVPPKLLKEILEQISTPLAKLFNLSLEEGIVPSEWKEANITPLFKKGSTNKPEHYRPVSLTSVVCKLLETLIRDHMVEFLVKHQLINTSQHGFLKARSCLTNLLWFF